MGSSPVPAVPAALALTMRTWPAGQPIHRVHADAYDALAFNPGLAGNARFSPIRDAAGKLVPTMYGGSTFQCAAAETVLHDVPFAPGLKTVSEKKFIGQERSVLTCSRALALVDLTSIALAKLNLLRRQLIDTEAFTYPQTRQWAEAIHAQCATAHGLVWVSRQDDTAFAVVLFGDRIAPGLLSRHEDSRALMGSNDDRIAMYDLAGRMGVFIVP